MFYFQNWRISQNLFLIPLDVWGSCIFAVSIYTIFIALFIMVSRRFFPLSLSFAAISGFFVVFFLAQVNAMSFYINEAVLLWLLLGFLVCILVFKRPAPFSPTGASKLNTIIAVIWGCILLLTFLNYSVASERQWHYGDEESFWFVRAKEIVEVPLQHREYRTDYGHSDGIPFIAAIPALMTKARAGRILFFMPFLVAFVFFLVVWENRDLKWGFLFLLASFLMFLNHAWISQILFRLIYGEGLSAAFCLAAINQLNFWHKKNQVDFYEMAAVSFVLGCMVFTKAPLSYAYISFLVPLLFIKSCCNKTRFYCVMLFFIPLAVFRLFVATRGIFFLEHPIIKTFSWDWTVFVEIGKYLFSAYKSLVIFYFLSLAGMLIGIRGRRLYLLIPLVTILFFVFAFYATIFSEIEIGSSARYLLHMLPAWFYLGAVGISHFMDKFLEAD